MAEQASDGFFDLEFNGDQTQVFATIHPPRQRGKSVAVEDIVARLRQAGVVYGIREGEIARAISQVAASNAPAVRALIAQGLLPVEGTDAQIQWLIDYEAAARPLPTGHSGAPDFFAVPEERIVLAGQVIATLRPAVPGSTGKSLTAPFRIIQVSQPREMPFTAKAGVRFDAERLEFMADTGGILEITRDSIQVHAIQWVREDLNGESREYGMGVIFLGSLTASSIRAEGPIAIRGTVAGCTIRAKGDVVLDRCARTKVLADGDVYVLGKLLHCQVVTPGRLVGEEKSLIMGGAIAATTGIQAADVGGVEGAETLLISAVDRFTPYRQQEVENEICGHEENIQKIARALRPLGTGGQEAPQEQKRALVQTLVAQRRSLEERVRALHHEKRTLLLASKTRFDAEITAAGTIYRGVTVQLEAATTTLDANRRSVRFVLDSFRESVVVKPLEEAIAA
jgi:uncharacterized protein (DUF342 family)